MARMMVFIDGENLVMRYQAMLQAGMKPKKVQHVQDIYVWHPNTFHTTYDQVVRATYYTYVVGDLAKVAAIEEDIKQRSFQTHYVGQRPSTLYPMVFKKDRKEARAKGVDIQMTVDMLTHSYQNTIDVVYLISGDGDYIPVINEVMRMGKQVYVAAFSSGLSPKLKTVVDEFTLLDDIYFDTQV